MHHRLIGIDLVRLAAALLVMAFHLCFWAWASRGESPLYPEATGFAWFGWLGVEIFFVVSGLVIAYSADGADAFTFFRRRVLRLVPTAFLCASATFAVLLIAGGGSLVDLLPRYLNAALFNPLGPWIDGVYWTLGIEVSFYALIFVLLLAHRPTWLERIGLILGAVSTAAWLERGLVYAFNFPAVHRVIPERLFSLLLLDYGVCFALGVTLWAGSRKGWTKLRVAALTVFAAAGVAPVADTAISKVEGLDLHSSPLLPALLWVASVTAIFLAIRYDRLLVSLFGRGAELVRVVGLATYPLYLLHEDIGIAAIRLLVGHGVDRWLALAGTALLMVVASIAIVLVAEPPIRRAIAAAVDLIAVRPHTSATKIEVPSLAEEAHVD